MGALMNPWIIYVFQYMKTLIVEFDDEIAVMLEGVLGERLGAISSTRHCQIKRALGYALDWPELKVLCIARSLTQSSREYSRFTI
jgi:hypothetical protein